MSLNLSTLTAEELLRLVNVLPEVSPLEARLAEELARALDACDAAVKELDYIYLAQAQAAAACDGGTDGNNT